MTSIAWIVLGEPHYKAVFLDYGRAVMQAAACHGVVKALVLEEQVCEMLRAAYNRGAERGNTRKD